MYILVSTFASAFMLLGMIAADDLAPAFRK